MMRTTKTDQNWLRDKYSQPKYDDDIRLDVLALLDDVEILSAEVVKLKASLLFVHEAAGIVLDHDDAFHRARLQEALKATKGLYAAQAFSAVVARLRERVAEGHARDCMKRFRPETMACKCGHEDDVEALRRLDDKA